MRPNGIVLVLALGAAATAAACEKEASTSAPKLAGVDLPEVPEVPEAGLTSPGDGLLVTVSMSAISIEGTLVLDLTGGKVVTAEKQGGALGVRIPRLSNQLALHAQLAAERNQGQTYRADGSPAALRVAVDRAQTFEVLYQVLSSAKPDYTAFSIVVRSGKHFFAIPIELSERPRAVPADQPPTSPDEQPVIPTLSVTAREARLWSISGLEGTLKMPKAIVPLDKLAELGPKLAEIATLRYAGKARTEEQEQVVLMCDSGTPMQTVATIAQVVLAPMADGKPPFPRLLLSLGFW